MKYYPVCLHIKGRKCLVVGGGRVAERKIKGLLDCDAVVHMISPRATDALAQLVAKGDVEWRKRGYECDDVAGYFLVMAATDNQQVQDQVQQDSVRHNILLNVADVPEKCNFILPAQVKRGSFAIAVTTSGKSPALAKKIRKELEGQFGVEYELLNEIMGLLRPEVLALGLDQLQNEVIFTKILNSEILEWIKKSDWTKVAQFLTECSGVICSADCVRSLGETACRE